MWAQPSHTRFTRQDESLEEGPGGRAERVAQGRGPPDAGASPTPGQRVNVPDHFSKQEQEKYFTQQTVKRVFSAHSSGEGGEGEGGGQQERGGAEGEAPGRCSPNMRKEKFRHRGHRETLRRPCPEQGATTRHTLAGAPAGSHEPVACRLSAFPEAAIVCPGAKEEESPPPFPRPAGRVPQGGRMRLPPPQPAHHAHSPRGR